MSLGGARLAEAVLPMARGALRVLRPAGAAPLPEAAARCPGDRLNEYRGTITESQALRRDEGNQYAPCDPCANCQFLYRLKTAAEKRQEEQAAELAAKQREHDAKRVTPPRGPRSAAPLAA